MDRYAIRFRSRRSNKVRYGVAEIWRLADEVKVHEEWTPPMGHGPEEAVRIKQLLEAAPDDQAETIVKHVEAERMRATIGRVYRAITGDDEQQPQG
jgi:hypothetical protein